MVVSARFSKTQSFPRASGCRSRVALLFTNVDDVVHNGSMLCFPSDSHKADFKPRNWSVAMLAPVPLKRSRSGAGGGGSDGGRGDGHGAAWPPGDRPQPQPQPQPGARRGTAARAVALRQEAAPKVCWRGRPCRPLLSSLGELLSSLGLAARFRLCRFACLSCRCLLAGLNAGDMCSQAVHSSVRHWRRLLFTTMGLWQGR